MSYLESLILGIVQGVTEFLPVSSSGHLMVARFFWHIEDIPVLYDVLLHISTLVVVILVFRRKIGDILASLYRLPATSRTSVRSSHFDDRENLRLCLLILAATAVTVLVGLLLSRFESLFFGNPRIVSVFFFTTALILVLSRIFKGSRDYSKLGFLAAAAIGLAQGFGVLPGISRSGITISAALLCGLDRERAGEFAFLVAIPVFIGALVFKLNEAGALLARVSLPVLALGVASSFLIGFFSLILLLRMVRRGRLYLFSFYLVPLSLITFLASHT